MESACIEEACTKVHQLRKLDRVIDVDCFRGKIKDLCCADNGRPAVLFKTLFWANRSPRRAIKRKPFLLGCF